MNETVRRRWPHYALFLKRNARPMALFYDASWARQAGAALWGWDNIVVGLWETPQDRECTLREVLAPREGT